MRPVKDRPGGGICSCPFVSNQHVRIVGQAPQCIRPYSVAWSDGRPSATSAGHASCWRSYPPPPPPPPPLPARPGRWRALMTLGYLASSWRIAVSETPSLGLGWGSSSESDIGEEGGDHGIGRSPPRVLPATDPSSCEMQCDAEM